MMSSMRTPMKIAETMESGMCRCVAKCGGRKITLGSVIAVSGAAGAAKAASSHQVILAAALRHGGPPGPDRVRLRVEFW